MIAFKAFLDRHLDQPETRVRLLVSGGDATQKRPALDPMLKRGAEVIEGDLADRASLDRATQGVDVIVSAVQGGPDIISWCSDEGSDRRAS